MAKVTRESIIEAAKTAAAQQQGPLTSADFSRLAGIGPFHLYRCFPKGGWSKVVELAGIARHPLRKDSLTDEEMLTEFHRAVLAKESLPTWPQFAVHARVSSRAVRRRFGGMKGTLKKYRSWLELHEPSSPFLQLLEEKAKEEVQPTATDRPRPLLSDQSNTQWGKLDGTEFGEPISFRGLQHAPINEQGVVYLFVERISLLA